MILAGQALNAELEFWTTDLIDWERVADVGEWYRFRDYWLRRVNYTPNAYGDTPYVQIRVEFDGNAVDRLYRV
jgi:hypothetical protein